MASVIQLLELATIGAYSPAFNFEAGESSNAPVSRAVRTSHRCRRPGASQTCVLTEVASDDAIAGQIAVAASTGGFAAAVQAFQVSLSNGHIPDSRDVAVLVESAALSGQGSRCWDVALTVAVAGVQQGLSVSQARDMCLCLRVVCACMLAFASEGRPDAIHSLWACFVSASQERERAERVTAGIGGGGWAAGAASFSASAAGSGHTAADLGCDLPAPLLDEHGQPRVDPWEHAVAMLHCALGLACGRAGVPGNTGVGKTKEAAGSAAPSSAASVVSFLKQALASSLRSGLGVHPLSLAGLVLAETHAGSKQGAREGMRVLMAEAGEGISGDRLLPLLIAASASSMTADLRAAVDSIARAAHAHAQGASGSTAGGSGRVASDVAQARVGEQAGYALHAHAWLAAAYSRSDEPLVDSILPQLHAGLGQATAGRGRTGEATVSLKDAQLADICSWLGRGSVPMRGTAASSPSLLPSLLLPTPGRPLSALQQPTHLGANLRAAYLCSAEGGSGAGLGKALEEFLTGGAGGGKYRLLPETLSLLLATLAQLAGWNTSGSTNKGAVRTSRAGDNVCILPAHLLPDLPPTPASEGGEGAQGAVVLIKDSASYVALIQAILACARAWGVRPRPVDIAAIVLIHGACGNIRLAMADIRASASPLPARGGAHPLAHPLYASLLLGMAKCQPGCVTKLDLEWVATRAGEDGVLEQTGGHTQAQGRPQAALALAVGSLAQALAAGGSGPELAAHAYTVFKVSPGDVAWASVAQGGGQAFEEGVGAAGGVRGRGEESAELQLAAVQSRSLPFLRLPLPCTAVASVLSRILSLRAPLLLLGMEGGAGTSTGATTLSSPALAILAEVLITGARGEEGGAQAMPLIFQSGQSMARSPPPPSTTLLSPPHSKGSPGKERREKEAQQQRMDLMPSMPGFALFAPTPASSTSMPPREAAGSTPSRAAAASPAAHGQALIPHPASSTSSLMGSPAPRLLSPGLWKAPAKDIAQALGGSKGGRQGSDRVVGSAGGTAQATTTPAPSSPGPQLSHELYGSSTHTAHVLTSRRHAGAEGEEKDGSEQVPLSLLPSGVIATLRPSSSLTAHVSSPDARSYGVGRGLTGTSSSSSFAVPTVPELLGQDTWRVPVGPTPYDGHRSALASTAPSVLLDPATVSGQGLFLALATAPPTLEVAPQEARQGSAVDSRDAALARAALPTAASLLRHAGGDSLTSTAAARGVSGETMVLEEGVRAIHADSARLEAQLHHLGSATGVAETELKVALAALAEARTWMGLEQARVLVKREQAGGKGVAALEDVQEEGALALAAPAKPAVSAYVSAGGSSSSGGGGGGGTSGKGRRGGAMEEGEHASSSVLAIRAIDAAPAVRARESALRAALLSLQAEEASLMDRLHASPLAQDLYKGYTDAVRTLSTTAAALQEGAAADDEAVMRLEDSVFSTRQGLRSWALGGAAQAVAEGKEEEQGALPPALADALVQLSSTLLSDTVRQVRRARSSVREGVSTLQEAGRAGVEALSALACEQEKVNAGLKAVIGDREAEVQAVQAVLSQCQEDEEHAQLALLSLSQHAARAASAHAAEHDRIEAALSRVRTSLARALSARVQDVQTDVASALEAAARKGRAAAAAEGSDALQAARTAAEAAVSAAWDELAASLGPEQHAAAAQEARERLAGLEGQMEQAVGAASRAAACRREMAARAKAEAQLLAQAQAELEASRAGTTAAHGILASVTGAPYKSTLGLKPAVPWDTLSSMLLHPAQDMDMGGGGMYAAGGMELASSAIPAQDVIDTLEGALLEHTERGMARLGEKVTGGRGEGGMGTGKEEGEESLPSHLTTTSLSLSTLLQLYEEEAQRIHKALHRTPRLNLGLGGRGMRPEGGALASPPPSSASSVVHGGTGRERGGLPTSYDLASPPREYAMDSPGDLERMLLGALHSAKAGARASSHHAASLLSGQAQPPLTSPSPSPAVQGYAAIAARKRESSKGRSLSPTSGGSPGVRAYSSYGPARAPVLPLPLPSQQGGKVQLTPLEALAASEHL